MMMRLLPLVCAVLMTACSPMAIPTSKQITETEAKGPQEPVAAITPCPDEADQAALNKLYPLIGSPRDSVEGERHRQNKIACIRDWAKALKTPCMRDGYLHWLERYKQWSIEHMEELSQSKLSKENEWELERKERARRVREYEMSHEIPDPPDSCSIRIIEELERK